MLKEEERIFESIAEKKGEGSLKFRKFIIRATS